MEAAPREHATNAVHARFGLAGPIFRALDFHARPLRRRTADLVKDFPQLTKL